MYTDYIIICTATENKLESYSSNCKVKVRIDLSYCSAGTSGGEEV